MNEQVEQSHSDDIVGASRQVVYTPNIEYFQFNGDPLRYVTFMHNLKTWLEIDNPDKSRKLQLLIQHWTGKARDAIESCINLPDGYEAHVKIADGKLLLELERHLTMAERTLSGMGVEYVLDLNQMNTLWELLKKLPMFLRAKWTECAGNIIKSGHQPTVLNLVKYVKDRAKLVDNKFGSDMSKSSLKSRNSKDDKGKESKRSSSFSTGCSDKRKLADYEHQLRPTQRCAVCSGQHGVWLCDVFKRLEYGRNGLCNKCLERGHIAKNCPKTHFKCLIDGCGKKHHTLDAPFKKLHECIKE